MSAMSNVAMLHRVDQSVFNVAVEMDKVVGSTDALTLKGQDVLLGVFIRPQQIRSSSLILITGDGTEAVEDVYQGKVLRILKLGPQAFNSKTFPSLIEEWGSEENIPKVGDLVFCRANDGLQISYKGPGSENTKMFEHIKKMPDGGGWPCRIVAFNDVIGKISDPSVLV